MIENEAGLQPSGVGLRPKMGGSQHVKISPGWRDAAAGSERIMTIADSRYFPALMSYHAILHQTSRTANMLVALSPFSVRLLDICIHGTCR